jgi:Tol biopolymer transport system component
LFAGSAVLAVAVAAGLWASPGAPPPANAAPLVLHATLIVPVSARPIAPAISPDGKWVTYLGLAGGEPNLYVQYLSGGPPVNFSGALDLPLQTRTVVGGIDVLPDGSAIGVAGRPRRNGLWRVPGIWVVPAPLGGAPRLHSERFAAVRWSPDGRQIAAVIANPLIGDAVAVAAADGQEERILVPAAGGMHLHQVAWGHDGHFVYFSRTLEPNHALGEIYRVAATGGAIEPVVSTQGTAMFPAPTPDGRAVIYAGDRNGEGLNIWWHPLDGTPERRLTVGAGEFSEPFISRDGRHRQPARPWVSGSVDSRSRERAAPQRGEWLVPYSRWRSTSISSTSGDECRKEHSRHSTCGSCAWAYSLARTRTTVCLLLSAKRLKPLMLKAILNQSAFETCVSISLLE